MVLLLPSCVAGTVCIQSLLWSQGLFEMDASAVKASIRPLHQKTKNKTVKNKTDTDGCIFMTGEMEAQRDQTVCSRSHSKAAAKVRGGLRSALPHTRTFHPPVNYPELRHPHSAAQASDDMPPTVGSPGCHISYVLPLNSSFCIAHQYR